TMTQKRRTTKVAQDKREREEITARRALRDKASTSEQEKNTPSGLMEKYEVDRDDIDEPRTTREQTKAQAIVASATPADAPQSENGAEV
ncbi:hypothetical protein HAX54_017394, partial [Datura stramonium]|nr:hypothetical protein [Datura stramonium]